MENKVSLEREYALMQLKIKRAKQLIIDLGSEKGRWKEEEEKYVLLKEKLIGDILVSSGVIAYAGPFTMVYRS